MDDIKAHTDGIGVWWAGHNAWLIKSGDLLISTDILLDYDNRAIPPPMTRRNLQRNWIYLSLRTDIETISTEALRLCWSNNQTAFL